MKDAVILNHLTKSYGKKRGIQDLSLTIHQGEIFGFLGPNGAGKSTTIRSLLGLIHPQKGSMTILGLDGMKDNTAILEQVGYMPSEAMFYPEMKVKDIIAFSAKAHHQDCREEARHLCEWLELDTEKKISDLSLGNRKKVSIVTAFQHKPSLYILDEPTSGLDPLIQSRFFELIQSRCKEGATCFLSSHVLSEIKNYCDRVAIIKEGSILRVDEVSVLTRSSSKRVHYYEGGREVSYVYEGDINDLLKELTTHSIEDLTIEEPSLEDIFMHYYEEEDK